MKLRIGERLFASKNDATAAVRKVLHGYSPGQTIGAADEAFMLDVFERHPEWSLKKGAGVASIEVEQNLGSRGFWITRVDGSRTDISFVKCLTRPTHEHDVRAAFRAEVRPQIQAFRHARLAADARCEVTGEPLTPENTHVDHAPPTFDEIVASFMAFRCWDNIKVNETVDGSTETLLDNLELAALWQRYHREHANLRLVTKRANLSILRKK